MRIQARGLHIQPNERGGHVSLPARGVRPKDLDEWVESMLEGRPWAKGRPLAASTARKKRSQLSALFSHAVRDGVVARTPFTSEVRKVTAVTVVDDDDDESVVDRLLTLDQITTLIDSAEHGATWEEVVYVGRRKISIEKSTRKSLATAVLLEIGAGTGLRAGEAGGLNVGDWNRATGMLEVRRQSKVSANGTRKLKTLRSRREVPVPDRLGEILTRYLFENPGPSDRPLLLTTRQTRWTARAIGGRVRSLRPIIDCDWVRFHDLRHFYATSLISGGLPITAVAELLGHTPATLLKIYAHYLPEDSDRAKRIIDGVLGDRGNQGEIRQPNLKLVQG
ncbi:tyrosine-type recombinase/integrase [Corynebacterium gallinarum]|uniref:Site-specific integrase n=1 Tax=Corynebacterium gallinarum TaxID=2762214 RepID=A0A8I0HP71_9CORY|nr:site-specific integrase [Corynebacterium gallinarum]MBD8029558.1 site-specific integrase [Corynebacterium gallinarum]